MITAQFNVVDQAEIDPSQIAGQVALFNEDGTPFGGGEGSLPPIAGNVEIMDSENTSVLSYHPNVLNWWFDQRIADMQAQIAILQEQVEDLQGV